MIHTIPGPALRLAAAALLGSLSLACAHPMAPTPDLATETFPEAQAEVKARLDQIWEAAARRDFDRLRSYHLYGAKFTEFKDGAARGDSTSGEAGERASFTALSDPRVEMRDLAIHVFGDAAVVTFNGHYTAAIEREPIAVDMQSTFVFVKHMGEWKIVHEHLSPLGPPPAG